jgi:hypothetical protein
LTLLILPAIGKNIGALWAGVVQALASATVDCHSAAEDTYH